eukprot:TRINITY_DN751_c0_g1_i3.p1 TRINITY_DN751_c0_g1~~TRINITY_DN751_c0_g1_i3.p1  ORF type:complete len:332 (+),score=48.25 TRINITY_DN751_c0_g1_i3:180-1175(+)
MKAFVFESKLASKSDFKASDLKFKQNYPIPEAGEGQLLVKVLAVSLNPVDYKVGAFAPKYPFVPGLDVAGTVEKVGPNVKDFKIGDRVHYMCDLREPNGGFAEYSVVKAIIVSRLPDEVSYEIGAALPVAGWTAWIAIEEKLRLPKGKTVLVTAAAGGVGGFAVQLAKRNGLKVIGTSSAKNFARVKKLGADHVIDYNTEDIEKRVKEITNGKGVDAWIDLVGPDSVAYGTKCLAFNGQIVNITAGNPPLNLGDFFDRQISFHEIFLGGACAADEESQAHLREIGDQFVQLLKEKKLDPMVEEVIAFEQIPDALARLAARHVIGKIVAKLL